VSSRVTVTFTSTEPSAVMVYVAASEVMEKCSELVALIAMVASALPSLVMVKVAVA